jgi:hypothetical protein
MSNLPIKHICITVEDSLIPIFFNLLQSGFQIEGNVGCSVKSFLCEQLGVAQEYLEKRIQTIFFDGKPVDDVDTAIVNDGTTLSLSAALPGLVGAVMRKGGYYAPMRDEISYKGNPSSEKIKSGKVFMKLFNLPLRELGPMFLEHGILVSGSSLKDILAIHADDFRKSCRSIFVDGQKFDLEQLLKMDWANEYIFLQVKSS